MVANMLTAKAASPLVAATYLIVTSRVSLTLDVRPFASRPARILIDFVDTPEITTSISVECATDI